MKRPHLKPVVELIKNQPLTEPPKPWKLISEYAVGGLVAVGFIKETDDLLVVSSNGRGLFDCLTGKKTDRDYNEISADNIYNPISLEALGIANYQDIKVSMSGSDGGGLPNQTFDGWILESHCLEFPIKTLTLYSSSESWGAYGVLYNKPHQFTKLYEDSEIRAFGFSQTGKTMVIATNCDLFIYGRSL